jgi:hypothetical protein
MSINKDELKRAIETHGRWAAKGPGWNTERRLDLGRKDLRWADDIFRGADLRGAVFIGADLRGLDFSGANLKSSYLTRADLRGTYLSGANLDEADCPEADFEGANLENASLKYAGLRDARLRGVDLSATDLFGANLAGTGIIVLGGRWHGWVDPEWASLGCQRHRHAFWLAAGECRAAQLAPGALAEWQAWRPVLVAAIECASKLEWPKGKG